MGSYTRLIKSVDRALNKNKRSDENLVIESDEDKAYTKYLESLSREELEKLYKSKWDEFTISEEWKKEEERLNGLSESELSAEISSLLKAT